jgi:hypothetical protein
MDVQVDFGENERDQDNQHGGELTLLDFAKQPIDPTHPMINRWCCGATSGDIRDVTSHVGYLFETEYYKKPEASPTQDFPRI